MRTRVQKWGSSLALKIPKSFAVQAGLCEDLTVDLAVVEGKLVVHPHSEDSFDLDDLLQGVTKENLHREWDTSPAVGKEIW